MLWPINSKFVPRACTDQMITHSGDVRLVNLWNQLSTFRPPTSILHHRQVKVDEFFSLFGKLFFAATVLRLPLYQFYAAVKHYRKVCNKHSRGLLQLDSLFPWWQSSLQQLHEWLTQVMTNAPRSRLQRPTSRLVLFTDASDFGFGVVLLGDGVAWVRGGTWQDCSNRTWQGPTWLPPINQREMLAVEEGAILLDELSIPVETVDLRIDNTTVRKAERQLRHSSFWINLSLRRKNATKGWRSVEYVSSADNLSDATSRGRAPDERIAQAVAQGVIHNLNK